jgi:HEAT repeat protein
MSRFTALVLGVSFLLTACDDPKDPQTWIKKLRDPEVAPKAVRELGKLGDPVAIEPLCDLYKDFESPEILKAIITLAKKDPKNKKAHETLISALEFTEDKYHNATLAAKTLADLNVLEAVEPLGKVLERPMAIKSRANLAKQAAIKALGRLKDKRAVPYLITTLERRPEQQDFLLNKEAATALGEIGDPSAISVLIRALFMASTIQGTSYPQARVAMVKIGKPAVQPLINALQGKDEKLNNLGKQLDFKEGVVLGKIARLLGDMMAEDAVPVLLEQLKKADVGDDYTKGIDGVIEGLGKIGSDKSVEPLLKLLLNKRANYKLRMQVCQAFTVMGSKKTIPALLLVAEKGEIEGGYTNLREGAAMAYSRIVGAEVDQGWDKMKEMIADPKLKGFKATVGVFKEALDRMKVARECKDDAKCYGKKVNEKDLSLAQREKAGIMIGTLPTGREALADLVKALPVREPVLRLYFLMSAKRIGQPGDTELVKLLEKLAEKDSKRKVKYLGADLASADKVTLAAILAKK